MIVEIYYIRVQLECCLNTQPLDPV